MLPGNIVKRRVIWLGVAVLALGANVGSAPATAQSGPPGITMPKTLPPFDPSAPTCTPPPGLEKALAFSQDTRREFMQGVNQGLAAAAKDRGLQYRVLVADSEAARQAEDIRSLVAAKTGGVVASAVDFSVPWPTPAGRHLVRRLRQHGRGTARHLAVECPAISHRQGSRRRGERPYQGDARRQGQGRAADPGQPGIPRAALRRVARFPARHSRRQHRCRHLAPSRQQGWRLCDDANDLACQP